MFGRDHLREVDEDRLASWFGEEDIELVEIAVNETGSGEADDEVHELRVEGARIGDFADLPAIQAVSGKILSQTSARTAERRQ